ncbi:hypothetical protein DFQ27_008086, partial [Actinomortierella ambigua]
AVMTLDSQDLTLHSLDVEAATWYHKAAAHGMAKAQIKLGEMCENGCGGLYQDDMEALRWFRKAADQGEVDAQIRLATRYSLGRGVEHYDAEVVQWFSKAAGQEGPLVHYSLRVLYR